MRPEQAVEFAQALAEFGTALSDVGKRKKWLTDMQALLKENQKAVRLLGAPQEMERQLEEAETNNIEAQATLADAREEADHLLRTTQDRLDEREKGLNAHEQNIDERNAQLRKDMDQFETDCRARRDALEVQQRALDQREEELKGREKSTGTREKKAEAREEAADKKLAKAERLAKGMKAVLAESD